MDNGPTIPARFVKVATNGNVSTQHSGRKKKKVIVLHHISLDTFQVLISERNTERPTSIRKIVDKGFEKLSKSGIHLILI